MKPRQAVLLALFLALALGCWARRSALHSGFWADDFIQYGMLTGNYPSQRAAWDLFHFVDGTAADRQRIVDFGVDPWWTHPHFRLSLLRPLPSLLRALDHQLFELDAFPQHVHSFLWWGLLVVAVFALFVELLPPFAASLSLLLFSVEESATVPVLWLANRSALMATVFAISALVFHVRWRRAPNRSTRLASVVLFALALSCGEYALASCGYFVCLELSQRKATPTRLRALAPFIGLSVLFLGLSALLGYGSAHSALYTSPFSAPWDYARKLLTGLPAMLGDLVVGIPADWWSFGSPWPLELKAWLAVSPETWERLPSWRTWQVVIGLVGAVSAAALLVLLRRRAGAAQYKSLGWLVAGATLGLFPVLGSFVTSRLALPSSIGFAALFGSVAADSFSELAGRRHSTADSPTHGSDLAFVGALCLSVSIAYVHGYRAFAQTESTTEFYDVVARSRTFWPSTARLDERKSAAQRMVMIAAADANDAPHALFIRAALGRPLGGFRLLSGAPGAHEVFRVDANTLDVHVLDDWGLAGSVTGSLTRAEGEHLSPGQLVRIAGMTVKVLEMRDGQPVRMRFRFDVPLEDDRLVFVHSTPFGLSPVRMPPIGGTLRLAPPTMPDLRWLQASAPGAPGAH